MELHPAKEKGKSACGKNREHEHLGTRVELSTCSGGVRATDGLSGLFLNHQLQGNSDSFGYLSLLSGSETCKVEAKIVFGKVRWKT